LNLFIHYAILIIRIHVRFIQKHHNVKENVAKCARHIKNINKIQNNEVLQATAFKHLPRHTSQSGCPRQFLGHLLLVDDQNSMSSRSSSTSTDCTPAPSNPSFLRNHHMWFRAMSYVIFLSFCHRPVSETFIHNANNGSKHFLTQLLISNNF